MAPTNATTQTGTTSQAARGAVGGKGKKNQNIDANAENRVTRSKRKADNGPNKNDKNKRSALGNINNNVKIDDTSAATANKIMTRSLTKKLLTPAMPGLEDVSSFDTSNFEAPRRRSARLQQKREQSQAPPTTETTVPIASAAETAAVVTPESPVTPVPPVPTVPAEPPVPAESPVSPVHAVPPVHPVPPVPVVPPMPEDVEDYDRMNWDDPFQVSDYAMDIFNYFKQRELEFPIDDYMPKQVNITTWMRTLLVDKMVNVMEAFELNHETLYLSVKIMDLYLCRAVISEERLPLLGAAAMLIACKYDDRHRPLIKDFLYMWDDAYTHDELVKMELETLRTIDYNLGVPLSYRFLRRYARCAQVQMPTLTLARYILELSLLDYATIGFSDSKMASAALFMALRMDGGVTNLNNQTWTSTLKYYTGYQLADFAKLIPPLNAGLHRNLPITIMTIWNKYSLKIFHEVTMVPLLTNEQLFQNNLDFNDSN